MRKQGKGSKGDKGEHVSSLVDPSTLIHAEHSGAASVISPSISPSSPESEGQSSSLPTLVGVSGMSSTGSYISDEPIPPPSPFDQPSTSKDFPIKVWFFLLFCIVVIKF